uniref:Apple domain-containing protein n=1 Tax=Haptolina ericina TaxID=156174 RepID=A0A7S3EUP3_9EUKA|mmetsp:Transcript_21646/g.48771  ORF Transcript_21646/g.48771 Transcript_21646/m.48771 type:complete len:229 (+) Transcript_21646:55-741(+)
MLAHSLALASRRKRCLAVSGKYFGELIDAVRHWRWLQCGGAVYERLPPALEGHWGAPPTVALVVPSGKRVPDPSEELLTAFVHLDHGAKFSPAQAGHGCPLLHVPRATGASMPIVGFCEMTPDNRDCHVGDMGAWGTQIKGATITGPRPIPNLSVCAALCRECPRCRFVSFSQQHRDCSWYNDCRVQRHAGPALAGQQPAAGPHALPLELRLLRHIPTGWDYVTLRVR